MQSPDSSLSLPDAPGQPTAARSADGAAPPRARLTQWASSKRAFVLLLLCVVAAVNLADRQLITILITPIKHEFGASDTSMGLLTGMAFAAVYVTAGLPIAYWSDRGSRRSVIAASVGAWSLMTMLCGVTQSFTQLAMARMGVAFGEAGCNPGSHSIIADLYSRHNRAKAIGFYNASASIGIGLGLFAGGALITHFEWRTVFVLLGAPGLLLALFIRLAVPEPPRGMSDPDLIPEPALPLVKTLRWLGRLRAFRFLALSAMGCAIVNYGVQSWAATFFLRVHGVAAGEIGAKLGTASAIGLLTGTILSGMIADRLSHKDLRWHMRIAAGGMLLAIPFGAAFLLTSNRNLAFIMYGLAIGLLSVWATPIHALTQTVAKPRMRGLAAAIVAFFLNVLGYGLGPLMVGILNDRLQVRFGNESIRYSLLILLSGAIGAAIICISTNRTLLSDYARTQSPLMSPEGLSGNALPGEESAV
ncbi:spinster family MFS transporter [Paraburkholderia sp. GAS32]|uniref:spinster family MFS transporter n=1 Tax=Paraburkholderia sp. GAS32 TaxID=3035129 RepID=UPI003D1B99A5